MTRRRNVLIAVAVLLATAVAFVWFLGREWLETQMKAQLEARGITGLEFELSAIGLRSTTFSNIGYEPVKLKSLELGYGPMELLRGDIGGTWSVEDVVIAGLPVELPPLAGTGTLARKGNVMEVDGGIRSADGEVHADFALTYGPGDDAKTKLRLDSAALPWDGGTLRFQEATVPLEGEWNVRQVEIDGLAIELPPLTGKGIIRREGEMLLVEGGFRSADGAHYAKGVLRLPPEKTPVLTVQSAGMPWQQGSLRVRGVIVPLGGEKPIALNLEVRNVPLDTLLKQATGGRASGSGMVSGTLPMQVARDGSFTLQGGKLQAQGDGRIALQPDVVPGDNKQVALLRDVLQDFHYTELSVAVDSDKQKNLSLLLSLFGNNPEVQGGRAVKLNVRLTGDVLSLFQQSVQTLTDPKKLLKQE